MRVPRDAKRQKVPTEQRSGRDAKVLWADVKDQGLHVNYLRPPLHPSYPSLQTAPADDRTGGVKSEPSSLPLALSAPQASLPGKAGVPLLELNIWTLLELKQEFVYLHPFLFKMKAHGHAHLSLTSTLTAFHQS